MPLNSLKVAALFLFVTTAFADELNLNSRGAWGQIDGAYFVQFGLDNSGTGLIQSFYRLSSNGLTEQGYNTLGTPMPDVYNGSSEAVQLSQVPTVIIGGSSYREFFLDMNETSSGDRPLLSLDSLQIYLGPDPNQ